MGFLVLYFLYIIVHVFFPSSLVNLCLSQYKHPNRRLETLLPIFNSLGTKKKFLLSLRPEGNRIKYRKTIEIVDFYVSPRRGGGGDNKNVKQQQEEERKTLAVNAIFNVFLHISPFR